MASDWRSRTVGPDAHETRGKTAAQRLRRLDQFLMAYDPGLLNPKEAVVIDLGYGRIPVTTSEWFDRLRGRYPHVRMVGVERDVERVKAAASVARDGLSFRQGDFQLPLKPSERVRLLRALNVLRQYEEGAAIQAHEQLVAQLDEGGLIAEGTCDPPGRTMVVTLLRRTEGRVRSEGLLFASGFQEGFEPRSFQAVLPKHLIHRVVEGEPIFDFFQAWDMAAKISRSQAQFGARQHFVAAAEALASRVEGVVTRRPWLRNGWLLWTGAPYP